MRLAVPFLLTLAACDRVPNEPAGPVQYDGIRTLSLDGDLVNVQVSMANAQGEEDVSAYSNCAIAQYSLARGYGFARPVRTQIDEEGGLWTGDAVYTLSPTLPRGIMTIDAEETIAQCARRSIPTV